MLAVRKSDERGYFNHGWLKTYHSFSFADYYDPSFMHFHSIRVINEDFIKDKTGFELHPHRDMEIVTYIVSGEVTHRDTLDNQMKIRAGEIQIMSAGSGILHSEHNESSSELHLYQIWIFPAKRGTPPTYSTINYLTAPSSKHWQVLASNLGDKVNVGYINQDAIISRGLFLKDELVNLELDVNRGYFLQVIKGELSFSGGKLKAGDALMLESEKGLELKSIKDSEVLFFNLA